MRGFSIFTTSSLAIVLSSQGQDKVTFQDHVRPIFENRCMTCHNPDKKKGGLDLSTFQATMAGGSGGTAVEGGDAAQSTLVKVITHAAEPFMPPKSDKMPQPEIDLISAWINGGLLDTSTSTAKIKKKANFEMKLSDPLGKPEGPPPMPENVLLEPVMSPAKGNAVAALAHSPWAPLVALAGQRQVLLYHSDTGELMGVLPFPEGNPETVGFSRTGTVVYAGGGKAGKSGIVALWDVKTGRRITTVGEETDSVLAADITPDHKFVALGGPGRRVKVYQTDTGSMVYAIKKHTDWVLSLAFSPDGVLLASADRNGGLYVWETATGSEFYTLKGHEKAITAVSWRADSNLVASVSEDGTARWWEMGGGTPIKNWPAHGGAGILTGAFSADGRFITGGRDGKARIFNGDAAQVREWVPNNGDMVLETCFTAPDMKRVLVGTWNGTVAMWDPVKEATEVAPVALPLNPPTIAQRLDYLNGELAKQQSAVQQAAAAAAEKEKAMAAVKAENEAMRLKMEATQAEQAKAVAALEAVKVGLAKLNEARAKFSTDLEAAKAQLAAIPQPAPPPPAQAGMDAAVQATIDEATAAQEAANKMQATVADAKIKELTEAVGKHDLEIAASTPKMQEAEKFMNDMNAQFAAMQAEWTPREQLGQAAEKAWQEAKAAADAVQGSIAGLQRSLQWWLAAKENTVVLAVRGEVTALNDQIENLNAEIAGLESGAATLTQQKSVVPPPAPEVIGEIDKKIAAATTRLAEARKELEAAMAQAAAKQQAADAAQQLYLSLLPK